MKKNHLLIACCCMASAIQAQLLPDSLLSHYNNVVPQEKLYVHFDNTIYIPGQTVWYKLYLQSTRTETEISRNVYIDWYDEKGKIIARNSSPVTHAASWGDFEVPSSYKGTRLYAVAYTQWMLNFDSTLLYRKELAVVQPVTNRVPANKNASTEPVLKFFPEGGDLVEGLSSIIAFKALNADGRPEKASGTITNKEGKKIATFVTTHDGMGKISFTPEPGETYSAQWTDEAGKTHEAFLPAAKRTGIVLTVNDGTLDRFFNLAWTADIPEKVHRLQIVAHSNQRLLFKAFAEIKDKKNIVGTLPLGRFPSGVITLTILNEAEQPLAERIVFVNNEEYQSNVSIGFDTVGLQKREKNVYEINIPDSISANLSLAITAGDLASDSADNIITALLLSSELKGHVHNPAYYFSSDEDSVKQQLDLVMLTNGWRRFKWEEAVRQKLPSMKYPKDDLFFSLTGTLKLNQGSLNQLKKAKTINLIFQSKDSSRSYALVPFNDNSWFEYKNMPLFDTVQVFYQLNGIDVKGQTTITPSTNLRPFNVKDSINVWQPGFITNEYMVKGFSVPSEYISPFAQGTTLAEVIVHTTKPKTKTRKEELNDEYTTGMFKHGDAYELDMGDEEEIKPSTNLITYLQSKVPGLRTENVNGNFIIRWRGNNSFGGATQGDPVAVLVNEIQTSASELLNMNATDIAYIKVFRPPFLGVPLGNGGTGAIAIYTNRGNRKPETGIDKFSMVGYTPIKDFYSPDYAEQKQSYNLADLRRTLYWKADIMTDGYNNKLKVVFYNNDISHSMQVVLEGMTDDGKLVHISRLLK